jgi:hypothetical protein
MRTWLLSILGVILVGIIYVAYEWEERTWTSDSSQSVGGLSREKIPSVENSELLIGLSTGEVSSGGDSIVESDVAAVDVSSGTPATIDELAPLGKVVSEIKASPYGVEINAANQVSSAKQDKPTFDVVSVDPDGTAVMAGRALPGSSVTLQVGDKAIGRAMASDRGEWVIIPDQKIPGGSQTLSLKATLPKSGETVRSDQFATIVMQQAQVSADDSDGGQAGAGTIVTTGQEKLAQSDRKKNISGVAGTKAVRASVEQKIASLPAKLIDNSIVEMLDRQNEKPVETTSETMEAFSAPATASPMVVVSQLGKASRVVQRTDSLAAETLAVTFDSVDYDEVGNVIIAGQVEAGADVRAYLDNKILGDVTADETGSWSLRTMRSIKPGVHELRIDHLDPSGVVITRAQAPFSPVTPDIAAQARERGKVIIQPGDNLWTIARHIYGQGMLYSVIYSANTNQIMDPDLIYPGQLLVTPGSPGMEREPIVPNERAGTSG